MRHIPIINESPPDFNCDNWEPVGTSPNGGREFFNKNECKHAIVYQRVVKIFQKLRKDYIRGGGAPYPIDFDECLYFDISGS